MPSSKSGKQWLRRHATDPYVQRARDQGYRSRAAFKLIAIDARERLLRPGGRIVDLGAAPGSWSQVAAERTRPGGRVVAIDLLEIKPIDGVRVLRGDFRDAAVRARVAEALDGVADAVLCDMAPNLSGIAGVDQARLAGLSRLAIDFCRAHLKPKGALVLKAFHGEAFDEVRAGLDAAFGSVVVRKPPASRSESAETYVVARGLNGGGRGDPRLNPS